MILVFHLCNFLFSSLVLGKDTNHRFKSTYNGPMGDYKQRRSGSEIDKQKKLSDLDLTPNGDTTPVNDDPLKSLEASFPLPIPLRPDKESI